MRNVYTIEKLVPTLSIRFTSKTGKENCIGNITIAIKLWNLDKYVYVIETTREASAQTPISILLLIQERYDRFGRVVRMTTGGEKPQNSYKLSIIATALRT